MNKNWLKKIVLLITVIGIIIGATACAEMLGPIMNEINQTNKTVNESADAGQGKSIDYKSIIAPDGKKEDAKKDDVKKEDAKKDDVKKDDAKKDVVYGESYTSAEKVAAYLHEFEELPPNFITKNEAYDLGWEPQEGNLPEVAPGYSIGGDRFGNREGLLPEAKGRQYYECDIDYEGGTRNAKRIVYSNDGLIFHTDNHYASFEQLY